MHTQAKSATRVLARDRVFNTAELLEMVLLNLDPDDALVACRINKTCHDTFNGSPLLKRHCFLEQDPNKVASTPITSDFWSAITVNDDGECCEDLFKRWPEGTPTGLYNAFLLQLAFYSDSSENMPTKFFTYFYNQCKELPHIFLHYDDRIQTGNLVFPVWPHLSSADLGSLGQMYFTSHPIPKMKVEIRVPGIYRSYERGRNWLAGIEVTLRNPRVGEAIDVVFGLIAKACLAQKQRKERQRELMTLQYYGPWDRDVEDPSKDMSEDCKVFAREHGLEKWAKVFDERLAGLCIDQVETTDESYYVHRV
ncbi:hypothetical protein AC578_934 [Pseudocercospora eumusae]|uniref:F-box domain-containing protein n=1 Tax=Pseudocercospora eumusae TaxID=321146 RepID=A0A139HBT0_9PEZI|nr:hypothetical protein AC578_934 [Pseudocercospora eumusae]